MMLKTKKAAEAAFWPTCLAATDSVRAAFNSSGTALFHADARKLVAELLDATAQVVNALLGTGVERVAFAGGWVATPRSDALTEAENRKL